MVLLRPAALFAAGLHGMMAPAAAVSLSACDAAAVRPAILVCAVRSIDVWRMPASESKQPSLRGTSRIIMSGFCLKLNHHIWILLEAVNVLVRRRLKCAHEKRYENTQVPSRHLGSFHQIQ
jgi:hypothetical protein